MKNILAIYSSITGSKSVTSQLADSWLSAQQANIIKHDLHQENLPHLNGAMIGAFFTPEEDRDSNQRELASRSDALIAELIEADTLLIAAPMYNFGVPSTLKAWVDQVARAGKTFKYTEKGPEGLVTGKKAIVITSRGGIYKDTGFDFQMPFINQFLNFIGITDIEVIYAEGVAMSPENMQSALTSANETLATVAA